MDLVQAQIRIAGGATLAEIGIGTQVITLSPPVILICEPSALVGIAQM